MPPRRNAAGAGAEVPAGDIRSALGLVGRAFNDQWAQLLADTVSFVTNPAQAFAIWPECMNYAQWTAVVNYVRNHVNFVTVGQSVAGEPREYQNYAQSVHFWHAKDIAITSEMVQVQAGQQCQSNQCVWPECREFPLGHQGVSPYPTRMCWFEEMAMQ